MFRIQCTKIVLGRRYCGCIHSAISISCWWRRRSYRISRAYRGSSSSAYYRQYVAHVLHIRFFFDDVIIISQVTYPEPLNSCRLPWYKCLPRANLLKCIFNILRTNLLLKIRHQVTPCSMYGKLFPLAITCWTIALDCTHPIGAFTRVQQRSFVILAGRADTWGNSVVPISRLWKEKSFDSPREFSLEESCKISLLNTIWWLGYGRSYSSSQVRCSNQWTASREHKEEARHDWRCWTRP